MEPSDTITEKAPRWKFNCKGCKTRVVGVEIKQKYEPDDGDDRGIKCPCKFTDFLKKD